MRLDEWGRMVGAVWLLVLCLNVIDEWGCMVGAAMGMCCMCSAIKTELYEQRYTNSAIQTVLYNQRWTISAILTVVQCYMSSAVLLFSALLQARENALNQQTSAVAQVITAWGAY